MRAAFSSRRMRADLADDASGDADRRRARGTADHDRIGADARVLADDERAEHLRAGADDDAPVQRRMALAAVSDVPPSVTPW